MHVPHPQIKRRWHMSLLWGGLVVFFMLWLRKNWPFRFCRYGLSTKPVLKVRSITNTTTQNTQQPTWAAADLPFSGFAIYHHGNISHGLKSWHSGSLWVRCRCPAAGSRSPLLVPSFGAPTNTPSKNRTMVVVLTFGGCHFMIGQNNQPDSWRSGRGGAWAEARGGGGAWGGAIPSFGLSNWSTKKYRKFNTQWP